LCFVGGRSPAALLLVLRADIRSRAGSFAGFVVLVAVAAGLVLTLLAGAGRTDTAYGRLVERSNPVDVVVPDSTPYGFTGNVDLDRIERFPEVASITRVRIIAFTARTDSGRSFASPDAVVLADRDDELGSTVERWTMLEGRRSNPDRVDEAVASFTFAEDFGVHVGSTIELRLFRADTFPRAVGLMLSEGPARLRDGPAPGTALSELADGPRVTLRIVGIEASPLEFPPQSRAIDAVPLHVTGAFLERFGDDALTTGTGYVRLRRGIADLPAFARRLETASSGEAAVILSTREDHAANVERSIHVLANGLRLLAALVALTSIAVVGQALSRQIADRDADHFVLSALGTPPGVISAVAILRAGLAASIAAALAAALAVCCSPLFPLGLARRAEPAPGVSFDAPVLVAGSVAVVAVVVLLAAGLAFRAGAKTPGGRTGAAAPARRSALGVLVPSRLSAPAATGIGLALHRDPSGGNVHVASTLLSATVAIAAVTAALVFGSSLDRLLDSPRWYGWTWDVTVGGPGNTDVSDAAVPMVAGADGIGGAAVGTVAQLEVGSQRVDVLAVEPIKGSIEPALTAGRSVLADDEIVLGPLTRKRLDVAIGEDITVAFGRRSQRLRVVGEAVFPDLGDLGQLGTGALTTFDALARLTPNPPRNLYLVDFDAASHEQALRNLSEGIRPLDTSPPQVPRDLSSYGRVEQLPLLLAGVMSVLGITTLTHTLLVTIRLRRRELAVLGARLRPPAGARHGGLAGEHAGRRRPRARPPPRRRCRAAAMGGVERRPGARRPAGGAPPRDHGRRRRRARSRQRRSDTAGRHRRPSPPGDRAPK
jgi:hypothetical protein